MLQGLEGFPGGPSGKEPACQFRRCKEMWVRSLAQEDLLEEDMASILAWRIPQTEEPGGLQSIESQRVRQDKRFSTQACTSAQGLVNGIAGSKSRAPWIAMYFHAYALLFSWSKNLNRRRQVLERGKRKVSLWGKERRRALRTKCWHLLILSGVFPGSFRSTLLW